MPTQLPTKVRAKAIRDGDVRSRDVANESIDWLALWALSQAFSSVVLAAIAYFGSGDSVGASMILSGTAAIIAAVLRADTASRADR